VELRKRDRQMQTFVLATAKFEVFR